MNKEPIIKKGDIVICRGSRGYNITEGREYIVLEYEPKLKDYKYNFVWPAYITFLDDDERKCKAHADRFILKQEVQK